MTTQPTLFDICPADALIAILSKETPALARATDPQTSHDAAAMWTPEKLTRTEMFVYSYFLKHGHGTDGDMEQWVAHTYSREHFAPSSLRKRRKDLVDKGVIEDAGAVDTSRHMKVWRLK